MTVVICREPGLLKILFPLSYCIAHKSRRIEAASLCLLNQTLLPDHRRQRRSSTAEFCSCGRQFARELHQPRASHASTVSLDSLWDTKCADTEDAVDGTFLGSGDRVPQHPAPTSTRPPINAVTATVTVNPQSLPGQVLKTVQKTIRSHISCTTRPSYTTTALHIPHLPTKRSAGARSLYSL